MPQMYKRLLNVPGEAKTLNDLEIWKHPKLKNDLLFTYFSQIKRR